MAQDEVTGLPSDGKVRGLKKAVERYGTPAIREIHYDVKKRAWRHWRALRRKRVGEVVLLLRRANGRYLVHTKAFYPQGTYRLPSGGIKAGESLVKAARREATEETGLDVRVEAFLAIVRHHFRRHRKETNLTSYLFLLAEKGGTLHPADEDEAITGFRELPLAEVVALADALEALPPEWGDWGRFRASVHRIVGEVMDEEQAG